MLLGLACSWACLGVATAEEGPALARALREGEPFLSLRYRYEDVGDDAVGEKRARASTLRTVLGYRTLPWRGWSLYVEAEDVTVLGNELYRNAGAGALDNGVRDRPVVADPEDTELNQAYLRLEKGATSVELGRREILHGDQRFVGNVGWRQNHQSFDALTVANASLEGARFSYPYLDAVHRIDGGRDAMASHLAKVDVDAGPAGSLSLYGYLLDYDSPARETLSSRTFGARLSRQPDPDAGDAWLYELAYALQQDAAGNPATLDADYVHAELGVARGALSVRGGFELLGGSPEEGQFRTPLATLHKFNGWADKFLVTPLNGLEDLYVRIRGEHDELAWEARLHEFSADEGSTRYGSELDLLLTYRAPWRQGFGLKIALYDADELAADTEKVMLWTSFSR